MNISKVLCFRAWARAIIVLMGLSLLSSGRGPALEAGNPSLAEGPGISAKTPPVPSAQRKLVQSTPADQRLKWFEDHKAMKKATPLRELKWTFIGPDIISGRVTDVAVHPRRKRTIFVASASGG